MLPTPAATRLPYTDWHTHASAYRLFDAREAATVAAMAARGAELGLEMMGIGEHVNLQPKHAPECYERLARDLRQLEAPIPLYLTAELDILNERGELSNPDGVVQRAQPDCVIASVHHMEPYDSLDAWLSQYQRLLLGAIIAPNGAHVFGHPWHNARKLPELGLVSEWRWELLPERMVDEVLQALRERGMALEINKRWVASFGDAGLRALVVRIRDAGVQVSIGSDAHNPEALDSSAAIHAFLQDLAFPPAQLWAPGRAREA